MAHLFVVEPAYEKQLGGGRLFIGTFILIIIIGEVVIYWGLSSGRNPPEYFGTAIAFLIALPLFAYFLIRSARGGRANLSLFIDSIAEMTKSWALVGPLVETGGYEADCELSNGCYVQCVFGLAGRKEMKGGLLRVFRFVKEAEMVRSTPLIKVRNDKKTLKTTKLPVKEEAFDMWQHDEELWKRKVSNDNSIRLWVASHLGWRSAWFAQPVSGNVLFVFVLCHDLYLRSPAREGEWFKGKAIGVTLNFIEPTERQEAKDFYMSTIMTADKIIQHVIQSLSER